MLKGKNGGAVVVALYCTLMVLEVCVLLAAGVVYGVIYGVMYSVVYGVVYGAIYGVIYGVIRSGLGVRSVAYTAMLN